MMPYIMYRDMGYDAVLVSYRNGDYPYLDEEVPGLRMKLMKKDGIMYFRKFLAGYSLPGVPPSEYHSRCAPLWMPSLACL
jgi:hypothetical protein